MAQASSNHNNIIDNVSNSKVDDPATLLVFSDLDGTLIHYPEYLPDNDESLLKLPPSSTGMRGVVSSETLKLTQDLRTQGKKFVLVSGMRTTTLLNRLPYLPKADAYCSEAGGRIFYPTDKLTEGCFQVDPKTFEGATKEDLKPFGIVEDMDWRREMEKYTGEFDLDGSSFENIESFESTPAENRVGGLWDYARDLQKKGYVIDIRGYSSCFRLNKMKQTQISDKDFQRLINKKVLAKNGLATSVNLSCIDIYPAISGKKNCCQYLGEKFFPDVPKSEILSNHAICLCDDDNDIEMALAVRHAYLPSLASKTMEAVIEKHTDRFTETYKLESASSGSGTGASDLALNLILESGN
ncbi:unnamed protein product [Cylindrotheca closterium]|uniref:Sucrose phosphatase-like domain-containing protein n=1 Tax=Cylindrotheca closterium TaxID=2856 RepID=A0AAD2FLI0_9STRA|nr:unnamed protein product [Cylindrotheca closterium]